MSYVVYMCILHVSVGYKSAHIRTKLDDRVPAQSYRQALDACYGFLVIVSIHL